MAGCAPIEQLHQDPAPEPPEVPDSPFGTLEIDFSAIFGVSPSGSSRDLGPPVTMTISRCDVTGTLEGGADAFAVSVGPGEEFSRDGLTPGLWTIVVDAVSPEGITIGRGETTAQIVAGGTTEAHITIAPLPGNGTLDLEIRYGKTQFQPPVATAEADVYPAIDGQLTLEFTAGVDGDFRTCTYLNTAVPAGYYTLQLRLIGDGVQVWGTVEAVRILADQITTGTWTYTAP